MTMAAPLAGKRILVVEDEYFIASDLRRELQREGAHVVGPAGDLARGLTLLEDEAPDAAVLDINLEGTNSYAIADRLAEQEIPYMFLTGYDGWAVPEAYRDVPRVSKPFGVRAMLGSVARLLDGEATA